MLVGLLVAMLLIQRFPHWVGLPSANVNLLQAPFNGQARNGPSSLCSLAVNQASPAVANLYTAKVVSKPIQPLYSDPAFRRFFGDNLPQQSAWNQVRVLRY